MSILQRGWIILREHVRDTTSRELHVPAAGILGVRKVAPGVKYDHQSVVSIHGVGDVDVMESVEEVFNLMDAGLGEFSDEKYLVRKNLPSRTLEYSRQLPDSDLNRFFSGTDYFTYQRDTHTLVIGKTGRYPKLVVTPGAILGYTREGIITLNGVTREL